MALNPNLSRSSSLKENHNSSRPQKQMSRSSEITEPIRRSFSGSPLMKPSVVANPRVFNPVTPANSPSDSLARGREKMRSSREYEDKENRTLKKTSSAKSPSISKGTKNFMSPTISAASKVCASPCRKILAERMEESQSKLDMKLDQKCSRKKVVFDSTVCTVEKSKPPCPPLAPLDADPLTPNSPYDPKTNYLAPRPKFLYYRPKSLHLDGEMDMNLLDDGFFADNFSETDATEESEIVSSQVMMGKEEFLGPDIAKEVQRKWFKSVFLIFLLLMGCLVIIGTNSQIKNYSEIRNSSFAEVMEVVVPQVIQHLRSLLDRSFSHWRDTILPCINQLIPESQSEYLSSFTNLTDLDDEARWLGNGIPITDISNYGVLEERSDSWIESEVEEEDRLEESEFELENESSSTEEENEVILQEETISEEPQLHGVLEQEQEQEQEQEHEQEEEQEQEQEQEQQQEAEKNLEESYLNAAKTEASNDRIENPQQTDEIKAAQLTERRMRQMESVGFNDFPSLTKTAIALLSVTLVILFSIRKRIVEQDQAETRPLVAKKFHDSMVSTNQMTKFDAVEDSCYSEICSYRKEQLATSSSNMSRDYSASPSYGSFTTYEAIPSKKKSGELMVTPLRRSSRLRK